MNLLASFELWQIILTLYFKPRPNAKPQTVIGNLKQTKLRRVFILLIISTTIVKGQISISSNSYNVDESSLYWTGTIAVSAINLTTTYFNIKKLKKYDKYRSNAIFGALFGCAQTVLGFANINANYNNAYIPTSINIGIGLTTLVTSIVRLSTKNPPKQDKLTMQFLYFQDKYKNNPILGLDIKYKFNKLPITRVWRQRADLQLINIFHIFTFGFGSNIRLSANRQARNRYKQI